MNDIDAHHWVKVMKSELDSMYSNQVWDLVKAPNGIKPVGCKWVYKRKRGIDGMVETFKARLVVKGYTQKEGIDYEERMVCKLKRSIYGLKQASRSWNIRFDQAIKSFGLEKNLDEPCVYKRHRDKVVMFLVLYVDDILLIGNDVGVMSSVKVWLSSQFDMKDLGEGNFILGIKLWRDHKNKILGLSQARYIDKVLERFSMQNSKKGLLPFRHGVPLSNDQRPKTQEEENMMRQVPYDSAVGSLMYAMLCTRPNICYSVGMVSRYQPNPGPKHWQAVKHILKYLRRTRDYMLVYRCEDLIPIG